MLAANVFAAETDEEAWFLRSSAEQAFVNLRTGRPGKLPRPVEGFHKEADPAALAMVDQALSVSATGSKRAVRQQLAGLIDRFKPDEIILAGMIHDHEARKRSYGIAAEALAEIAGPAAEAAE